MALIFLEVLIIFTITNFDFQQVRLPWLHRYWRVASIYPISIHWVMRFGGNAGVLIQAAIKVKNSFRVQKCTLVNSVVKALTTLWSTASDCRHVC